MSELELFGLDGWRGWFRRNKGHAFVPAPGQKCLNCDHDLKGRFCYHCGQDADTHHRTLGHLIYEAFEGLFHLDGRLWTTLPPLFFAPGKLARDLLEGRTTRHVPPFRIFLVALLVFMLVAEHVTEEERRHPPVPPVAAVTHSPSAATADAADGASDSESGDLGDMFGRQAGELQSTHTTTFVDKKTGKTTVVHQVSFFAMTDSDAHKLSAMIARSHLRPQWLKDDLIRAFDNKEAFFAAVFNWGHRLALLMLPIVGLSLGLLYAGKRTDGRRLYLYDHLLVSMNLLSFMFFIGAFGLLLPSPVQPAWQGLSVLWTLWNIFSTLRGAYGSSIPGAIVKAVILWLMTGFAFSLVVAGVILTSLTLG